MCVGGWVRAQTHVYVRAYVCAPGGALCVFSFAVALCPLCCRVS